MYPVIRAKFRDCVLEQKDYELSGGEKLEYLSYPSLEAIDGVQHLFSTKLGGVSEEEFATLNFSFTRGDSPEYVLENYRRIGEVLGVKLNAFVATDQTHTTNIRVVTKEDAGKGIVIPRDYTDIDGLITKEKGLVLSCFFADCVPLYFVDSQKKVIGLAHSGWAGTVHRMGACMVQKLQDTFGCNPADLHTAIGPSICQACYEISEEVANFFKEGFWAGECVKEFCMEAKIAGLHSTGKLLESGKMPGKYQLDLWLANYIVLRSAGIKAENIAMTDICTKCNSEYLFSHRATGGKRGNLAAFLMLK